MLRRLRFEEWLAAGLALAYVGLVAAGVLEPNVLSYFTEMGLRALAVLSIGALAVAVVRGRRAGKGGADLAKQAAKDLGGFVRDWIPWVVLVSVYENSLLLTAKRPRLYDLEMFRLDELVFGTHLDQWLQKATTLSRTNWVALFYDSLYLYTVGLGGILYLLGRHAAFRRYLVSFLAAGYLGYALYFVFPVVGPYYYFDEIYTVSFEGDRDTAREASLRHAGANDPKRVFYDVARRISEKESYSGLIPRNCFPSLHTAWGLLILASAWRARKWAFAILVGPVSLMIFGTIYLRFHYTIDLVAGAMLALFVDTVAPELVRIGSAE
jgi:membrane-associated phospholipid phosphatase